MALTRWHSCLSPCRTPAGPQARVQAVRRRCAVQGCRLCAASRHREADRLRSFPERERQGLCPFVPKAEVVTPVWRAAPAGPRQGDDSAFPSPTHPRRKAGRRHAACSRRDRDMGDLLLMYRAVGAETREDNLREVANENGLPFDCVRRLADRLGERQDFGMLVRICEERCRVR